MSRTFYFAKGLKSPPLMTQQYRNFTIKFTAYLFIKLPESENARKQNVWYS